MDGFPVINNIIYSSKEEDTYKKGYGWFDSASVSFHKPSHIHTHSSLKSLISPTHPTVFVSFLPFREDTLHLVHPFQTNDVTTTTHNNNNKDVPLSDSWDHEIYHSLCENALTKTEILDPYLPVYKYPELDCGGFARNTLNAVDQEQEVT